MTHDHGTTGWALFDATVLALLVLAAAGWAAGLWAARHRDPWPAHRTVLWFAGLLCAGTALVGPLAGAARAGFTAHMAGHLLLGMAAPLLLVLAAPVTLALRALPVARARALSLFLLADIRRRGAMSWGRWTGGLLAGLGAFQLVDGVVLHKVLRIHQIRYDVDLLVYDATWIGTAVLALAAGLLLLRRTRPHRTDRPRR